MTNASIRFKNPEDLRILLGNRDRNLRKLCDSFKIKVVVREGIEVHLRGEADRVAQASALVYELQEIIEKEGFLAEELFDRVLLSHTSFGGANHRVRISRYHNLSISARTPGQQRYIDAIQRHDMIFCVGPAGCGKTYLAVAMAVQALMDERVKKIVLVRPAVEAGEKLGFLPGSLQEKVIPYLRPLLDALADLIDYDEFQRYLNKDIIEIIPLAYMRGRTLNDTFIILDEAQNTTVSQMLMFLTRMGERSKIVVTGDITQVDLPAHQESGLADALVRLRSIPEIAMVELGGEDIVRHPLVGRIVLAYESTRAGEHAEPKETRQQFEAAFNGNSLGSADSNQAS